MLRRMLAQLLKLSNEIQASYWFLPSVMAAVAIVVSFITTRIDTALGMDWLANVTWMHANTPDGARTMLSTIAGSMMTVAGVTFSVTIAAVAYTTSQFGPRLLGNFMRDTGNQITLGTFIATFLYCLMLMRTVYADIDNPFVPQVGLLVAIMLALASIAVFIYFIHHVAESIHISNVVANIGRELTTKIDKLGQPTSEPAQASPALSKNFDKNAAPVVAGNDGYVQTLVDSQLLETARNNNLVVRVERGVGEFVHTGEVIALAWPAQDADKAVLRELRSAYALGSKRTVSQDPMFLVNELIEIAARALSPGINDPFTAASCMDWLRSALVRLASTQPPSPYHLDADGKLRLILTPFNFKGTADAVLHGLRPYFCADVNASVHMLQSLGRMAPMVSSEQRRQLEEHAGRLLQASLGALPDTADQARVKAAFETAAQRLQG